MFGNKTATKFAKKNRATILPVKTALILNDIIAILLFATSLIIAIMLFTYNSNDDCWFKTGTTINNKLGFIGAYSSDFIYSMFGFSGWWLVVGVFYWAYRKIMHTNENHNNWLSIIKGFSFLLLLLSSSIFEYLTFYNEQSRYLHNGYGGLFALYSYSFIIKFCGELGAIFLSMFFVISCTSFIFNISIFNIIEKIGLILEFIAIILSKFFKFLKTSISKKVTNIKNDNSNNNLEDVSQDPLWLNDDQILKIRDFKKNNLDEKINVSIQQKKSISNTLNFNNDQLPNINLLNPVKKQAESISKETLEYVSKSIENKLLEFGVDAKIVDAQSGPVVTRYELLPASGVRGEKIVALSKEIARGLALSSIRIVETIPGKNTMGIEVPNYKRQIIYLKEILDNLTYSDSLSKLSLVLGKDIAGNVIVTDLAKMPHLLVAGTTGSGKSVAINVMILSILFKATMHEVKFIMIDPKMVELSFYQGIPHLLAPVITDPNQAVNALKWVVAEMERRYKVMATVGCKNIIGFNEKVHEINNNKNSQAQKNDDNSLNETLEKWAYIVVIIDELADLMMSSGKKVEQYIVRIAQKARAVGIHLIVATQRPSVDVITGLIKANIPARISFQVTSKIDSRTILDQGGAETLLGQGDMLFMQPGSGYLQRVHGAFVNDNELNKVVDFLKTLATNEYIDEILTGDVGAVDGVNGYDTEHIEKDSIFDEVVQFFYDNPNRASISSIQTRFGVGYNRAARIMSQCESIGLVIRNEKGGFKLARFEQQQ